MYTKHFIAFFCTSKILKDKSMESNQHRAKLQCIGKHIPNDKLASSMST